MSLTTSDDAAGTRRRAVREIAPLVTTVLLLHVVGIGGFALFVEPQHLKVGSSVFGFGIAVTVYLFGLRHAFDPDHIAAIDNTTRALGARTGRRPKSLGLWFSLGHSTMVAIMSAAFAFGIGAIERLAKGNSRASDLMGLTGTLVSGGFLVLIGVINFASLVNIGRAFFAMRRGQHDEDALNEVLDQRGFFNRFLNPLLGRVARPWQICPIGMLFGLGFDTASEVALLVLTGAGSQAGIPWYAIMCLPVIFAAGMSLMDTADGIFMGFAYDWAFQRPVRKIYYNFTITALSILVAVFIGSVEIAQVAKSHISVPPRIVSLLASVSIDNAGYIVVGMFVVAWGAALAIWKLGGLENRWDTPAAIS